MIIVIATDHWKTSLEDVLDGKKQNWKQFRSHFGKLG